MGKESAGVGKESAGDGKGIRGLESEGDGQQSQAAAMARPEGLEPPTPRSEAWCSLR